MLFPSQSFSPTVFYSTPLVFFYTLQFTLESFSHLNWFPGVWALRYGFCFILFVYVAWDHKSICILSVLKGENICLGLWMLGECLYLTRFLNLEEKSALCTLGVLLPKEWMRKIILFYSSPKSKLYHYPGNPLSLLNMWRNRTPLSLPLCPLV